MSYPYLSDLINHLFGTNWTIPIAMFGTFVALAILIASALAKKEVLRFEALGLLPQAKNSAQALLPAHAILSDLVLISTLFGILGARIFHILEYPYEFIDHPLEMIFSRSGLTIYGGLIFGAVAGAVYLKKRAVPVLPMLDALSPSIILAYAIGRIGCQISGDGDWGMAANLALKPDWIPTYFWAQTYTNNIAGVVIASPGVYPTPIYESLIAFGIFLFLWAIRKMPYSRGVMFSTYLLLSGFARLLIEKIRINSAYHFLGISFTQAELISVLLITFGLLGIWRSTHTKYMSKMAISLVVAGALTACVKL
ncbi:prolipoprotein diacylglyceryl transferase [Undibacterium sp. Ren11W]|uniref:prolipoprotein diacylglyceryl transferase n=1 Tax=Undibacterium sp. Ren11W TaxID=3413045 RepID=UPI003BF11C84